MKIPEFYKGLFKYESKMQKLQKNNYNSIKLKNLADAVVDYLIGINGALVKKEIQHGNKNIDSLLEKLSDWTKYSDNEKKIITFIGTRLTTDCNLLGKDRCVYCDQKYISEDVTLKDYKRFMSEVYEDILYDNFYFSISGGEPLLWRRDLYGDNGLIRFLNNNGTYTNMNSNLHLLNSDNVLDLLNSGLNSLRVSFDVSDELLFDDIVTKGAFKRTLFSIYLLIRYKRYLASRTPRLFYNVVATSINVNGFSDLIDFLISFLNENKEIIDKELIKDLMSIHLIPLGGEKNRYLMPSYDDWDSFINETIPNSKEKWKSFLNDRDINIFDFNSFGNPLNQDMYNKPVEDIIDDFVNEKFNKNISAKKCYCAPTQLYILPNGDVYPCSCHAERLFKSLGNIKIDSFNDILKRNISYLNNLPNEYCKKCPISAVKINVKIEKKLIDYLKAHIKNCGDIND